ncbi:MAG: hypothetical protein JW734_00345 [Candidatus Omnitrophica bacterium]|nr:hypothetical protein [Candidatus Omnitrophota bacterium]
MPRLKFLKTIGLVAISLLIFNTAGSLAMAREWIPLPDEPTGVERPIDDIEKGPGVETKTVDEASKLFENMLTPEAFIEIKLALWGLSKEEAQGFADDLGISLYEFCKESKERLVYLFFANGLTDIAEDLKNKLNDGELTIERTTRSFNIILPGGRMITVQIETSTEWGEYKYYAFDPDTGQYETEIGEGYIVNTKYTLIYYSTRGNKMQEDYRISLGVSETYKVNDDGSRTLHKRNVEFTQQRGSVISGFYQEYQLMLRTPDCREPEMLLVAEGGISGRTQMVDGKRVPVYLRKEGWTYRYSSDEPQGVKDMATLEYTWYKREEVRLERDGRTIVVDSGTTTYNFNMQWSEFSQNPSWGHWVTFSGGNVTGGALGNVWLDYIDDYQRPRGEFDFHFDMTKTDLRYGGYDENGNPTTIWLHMDGIMYSPNWGDASWTHIINHWYVPGSDPLHIAANGGCWTNQAWGTNFDPSIVPDRQLPPGAIYSAGGPGNNGGGGQEPFFDDLRLLNKK